MHADEVRFPQDFLQAKQAYAQVLGVLNGHAHITFEEQMEGIPLLGLRSTAYPFAKTDSPLLLLAPPHYRFVTIQNNILTSRIYTVSI